MLKIRKIGRLLNENFRYIPWFVRFNNNGTARMSQDTVAMSNRKSKTKSCPGKNWMRSLPGRSQDAKVAAIASKCSLPTGSKNRLRPDVSFPMR